MKKWAVEPIYTGKNIFDYAESHYNKENLEIFDTYEEAEKRKMFIEKNKNIKCQITVKEVEMEEQQYCYLQII